MGVDLRALHPEGTGFRALHPEGWPGEDARDHPPAARSGGQIRRLEGRSLSYETSTPYAPLVDLLSRFFGLRADGGQPDPDRYGRVRTAVAELMPDRADEIAPFLASLLGIGLADDDLERVRYLEPPQLRGKVFRAVSTFFEHLAEAAPTILVLEDLHGADAASLDLLEHLLPLTERAPLAVVALFRPQRQEPSWRFHETASRDYAHGHTPVALEPLDDGDARALVANLLHVEDLPQRVRVLILTRAEGNPFFVEEVIRSLIDTGLVVREDSHWRATREIEQITIPDTLAGVIDARLDRLAQGSRPVAQSASVVGREFQLGMLASVHEADAELDEGLADLERRELIRETSRVPDSVYWFKHGLTQETAYASLLLSRRRELHRRVAERLEQIDRDRAGDIARHFLGAQAEARALSYLVEAGDRAARAYAAPAAIDAYTRAIEILQTVDDPALARRAYEGLGGVLMLTKDMPRTVEHYHAMVHYAEAHEDRPMKVSALNKLSRVLTMAGQLAEVEHHLGASERLATECDDKAGLAEHYWVRCSACTMTADFAGAVRYLGESVKIGRELTIPEHMAFGLTHIASTLGFMTRFGEIWQPAQEGLQIARDHGNLEYQAVLFAFPITLHYLRNGDLDEAARSAEAGVALATKTGLAYPETIGSYLPDSIALARGEHERAIASFEQALRAAEVLGMPMLEVIALGAIGSAYLDLGEAFADRVNDYHARAVQLLEQPAGVPGGGAAWAELCYCLLAKGDPDRAKEFFQKGLTVPTVQSLLNRSRFLVGSALVALARGRPDQARDSVAEARAFVEERKMKHLDPFIELASGLVSAARGEPERALDYLGRAEAVALEMQMRPLVWQAQAETAKLLAALGRAGEAESARSRARATVDAIASLFSDETLRAAFLASSERRIEA